ncbi:MAG: PEGA domain-containing protein, partial [Myxococcota bacterium]|nr:PEGA domain-containing protein [Myxococcota bacterium]
MRLTVSDGVAEDSDLVSLEVVPEGTNLPPVCDELPDLTVDLGEVVLRRNDAAHVARGAKAVEVEGIAKPVAARVMSLATGGQTLLTHAAFELARRASRADTRLPEGVHWLSHGDYRLKGVDEPLSVYEVGVEDHAPLRAPSNSEKVQRVDAGGMPRWVAGLGLAVVAVLVASVVLGGREGWWSGTQVNTTSTQQAPGSTATGVTPAPTPEPDVPAMIEIRVLSTPPGARVQLGDSVVASTPGTISVPVQEAEYPMRGTLQGFAEAQGTCVLGPGQVSAGEAECALAFQLEAQPLSVEGPAQVTGPGAAADSTGTGAPPAADSKRPEGYKSLPEGF